MRVLLVLLASRIALAQTDEDYGEALAEYERELIELDECIAFRHQQVDKYWTRARGIACAAAPSRSAVGQRF